MSSAALKMKQQGGFEQRMAKGPDGEALKPNFFCILWDFGRSGILPRPPRPRGLMGNQTAPFLAGVRAILGATPGT